MMRRSAILLASALLAAACSAPASKEPVEAFPGEPIFETQLTWSYSLTESPDRTVRVFASERGDETWLYESRLENGKWTAPVRMELPGRKMITGPSFSHFDGALYFSSDAALEALPGRKDLNLWRVPLVDGEWGEAEPLPGDLNTGANETMAVVSRDGTMVFASNHSRLGAGGYDIGLASQDADGNWMLVRPLDELNDGRTDDHIALTADGDRLFFYSHRAPKEGVVDIWTSKRLADGSWETAVNPGPPLNTSGVDFGAGLSGDGKILFFSREGKLMQVPLETLGY